MKTKYKILIISSIILCILVLCSGCRRDFEEQTTRNTISITPLSDSKINVNYHYIQTIEHDSCKWIIYNRMETSQLLHHPNCKNHKDGKREKPK